MVPPNPQIIHFNKVFHCKPSILGYPYFWKHPCVHFFVPLIFGKKRSKICSQCWFQRCLIHVHPYLGKGLVLCLPRFAKSKLLYIYIFPFFQKTLEKINVASHHFLGPLGEPPGKTPTRRRRPEEWNSCCSLLLRCAASAPKGGILGAFFWGDFGGDRYEITHAQTLDV